MIITGGNGFIGSHLAKHFHKAKVWDRINGSPEGFDSDVIIHLAASTHLAIGYSRDVIDDNIIMAHELSKRPFKKLVYASSSAVHNLNNLYAYSKKYAEELFADRNATGLRYYTVYGENDIGVVGKLIDAILHDKPFTINGGHQIRDFVYVDDVVNATIEAIDSKEKIIEIGTGVGTTIIELKEMIENIIGKTTTINTRPLYDFETKISICPAPLKKFTSLEEGLKKTIAWKKSLVY